MIVLANIRQDRMLINTYLQVMLFELVSVDMSII